MTILAYNAIYALCDSFTGEVRYVGKTAVGLEKRFKRHLRNAANGTFHVHRWLRSLDTEPHIRALEENPADINEAEIRWISFYRNILGGRLCNIALGGEGGGGATRLGYVTSPETRAKISAAQIGKPKSAETRARMSASKKGHAHPEHVRAKLLAANIGNTHSVEHIAKISAANTGKTRSEESKARMSSAQKDRWAAYAAQKEKVAKI